MICSEAKQVVFARGRVPADVLFAGEAPGASEDALGKPFVGPAGKLLDHIIERAFRNHASRTYCLTNLVGCIPFDENGVKTEEPDPDDILACSGRLLEFVRIVQPKLIVCVGSLPEKWIIGTKGKRHILAEYECARIPITHPAAVLRMNIAAQGLAVQRCVVNISNALEDLPPSA